MAIAFVFTAVMVFAVARPVAASNRYWAIGADVQISLIDHCGSADHPAKFKYPAKTAFFIFHGWAEQPWSTDSSENKDAFMGPATYFEFRLDYVPQPSSMFARDFPDFDLKAKLFVSEYDAGLTGTHRLAGLWFIDGQLIGETPGETVFAGGCVVNVTFV